MAREIITDIKFLRKKSEPVGFFESRLIIRKLEKILQETNNGIGLSAVQIGILKKVSIIRLPKFKLNLINSEIVNKDRLFRFPKEGCLSLPGLAIDTKRYNLIQLDNKKIYKELIAVCIAHEIDHQNGILILDRKWKKRK